MMDDRQLLEDAAKAAGYRVNGWIGERFYVVDPNRPDGSFDPFVWAPLTDDGDALRLAVKLSMNLVITCKSPSLLLGVTDARSTESGWSTESHAMCPYAATRRAIVRAAAEIGKAK